MLIFLRRMMNHFKNRGFTLIELLVVIAILGVLASVILGSINSAREKGKIAKTQADLRNVRAGMALLASDTGKWPNGCPIGVISNPEIELTTAGAGLSVQPEVIDNGGGCEWTNADILEWNGPYMQNLVDTWGNAYWFDPDYRAYAGCPTIPAESEIATVLSFGPNGVGNNTYDCDDVFLEIQ